MQKHLKPDLFNKVRQALIRGLAGFLGVLVISDAAGADVNCSRKSQLISTAPAPYLVECKDLKSPVYLATDQPVRELVYVVEKVTLTIRDAECTIAEIDTVLHCRKLVDALKQQKINPDSVADETISGNWKSIALDADKARLYTASGKVGQSSKTLSRWRIGSKGEGLDDVISPGDDEDSVQNKQKLPR